MIQFFLLQVILIAVVLLLHTYLGLHIVRRCLIFSDLVLDQMAAFGAMTGIGLGVRYGTPESYLFSLAAVLLGAFLLAAVVPRNRLIPREAVIGIMYALALVFCLLLSDKLPEGSILVTKTLTGTMLWVSWPLVIITAAVYAVLILFHWKFRRQFIDLTERFATVDRPRLWDFLFFVTQGIITVLIVPVAGVLLAYSFLMLPASTVTLFTRNWGRALAAGWGLGLAACSTGLVLSYRFNLPYGPTLVLSLGVVFLGAVAVKCVWSDRAAISGGEEETRV